MLNYQSTSFHDALYLRRVSPPARAGIRSVARRRMLSASRLSQPSERLLTDETALFRAIGTPIIAEFSKKRE